MEKKRSLLQKYSIPIHHLDFKYIETCTDKGEMENIVRILRSGQEGYYPDLTKCAEDKLHEIYPNSKVLRKEVPILTKHNLTSSEWTEQNTPVIEWSNDAKTKDQTLLQLCKNENEEEKIGRLPPVRMQKGIIDLNKIKSEKNSKPEERKENVAANNSKNERIKSTDYNKWDKYDADTEIWKMDLKEEKEKEDLERQNQINLKKSKLIQDITDETPNISGHAEKLSTIEKDSLSTTYKNRGNEYFRTKEYSKAVDEYTKSISILPKAAVYNNRAIANIKLKKFDASLMDCDKCLEIEPHNIKALLRKAEVYLATHQKLLAFKIYNEIISIEPQNPTAQDGRDKLRNELPNLEPVVSTRIVIEEEEIPLTNNNTNSDKSQIKETPKINAIQKAKGTSKTNGTPNLTKTAKSIDSAKTKSVTKPKDADTDDWSKLIIPKKIVKSKLTRAMETLAGVNSFAKNEREAQEQTKDDIKLFDQPEIKILNTNYYEAKKSTSKGVLIEEIN